MINVSDSIGYIAGVCTTFGSIPQIIKCYQTKSTKDLSYITLGMFESGVILWTVYGALNKYYPIIIWNIISTMINTTLIFIKIKYDKNGISTSSVLTIEKIPLSSSIQEMSVTIK